MTEQEQDSKPTVIEVEIDGELEQFSADDVKNLKAMQKSATEKFQKASPALKAAETFGFDNTEDYVESANYALERFHQLMQEGIIDTEGNVVKQQDKDIGMEDTARDFGDQERKGVDVDDVVEKALGRIEEKISKSISGVAERMNKVERVMVQKGLQEKYPNLSPKEIGEVFARANREGGSIFKHAEDVSNESLSFLGEIEKRAEEKIAQQLGISLEELNKRKEQPPEGGASAITKGKSIKFVERDKKWGNTKRDPNAVNPKEAMKEFFKHQNFQN